MTLKAVLAGGSVEGAYVQFVRDGEILGSSKVGEDGVTLMTVPSVPGKHVYRAYYSGNADVSNAESNELVLEAASVEFITQASSDFEIVRRKGGVEVRKASAKTLDIFTPAGEKVKTIKTDSLPLLVSLSPGLYIISNLKFLIE